MNFQSRIPCPHSLPRHRFEKELKKKSPKAIRSYVSRSDSFSNSVTNSFLYKNRQIYPSHKPRTLADFHLTINEQTIMSAPTLICFCLLLSLHYVVSLDSPAPSPEHPADSPAPSPGPVSVSAHHAPEISSISSPPAPPPSDLSSAPSPSPPAPSPAPAPAPAEVSDLNHSNINADGVGSSGGDEGGMSGGKKAGIALGVILAAGVVVVGGLVYKKRQDNIRRAQYGYAARTELL